MLVLVAAASIAIGAKALSVPEVWHGLFEDSGTYADVVVADRLSRTVLGLLVGAALGLSGAVLQALTRNPLADPGLLGINAGASAAVVTAISFLGVTSLSGYVWFAFLGAAAVGIVVWFLGVIQSMPAKVARTLGLLPQSSIAADGITITDLVGQRPVPAPGDPAAVVDRGRAGRSRSRWRKRGSPNSPTGC
ncbi:Vitamin B12 import system permease protein BtuC [Streptomyces alboniger]